MRSLASPVNEGGTLHLMKHELSFFLLSHFYFFISEAASFSARDGNASKNILMREPKVSLFFIYN